jgi:uncharacterized protein (DUF924 family)
MEMNGKESATVSKATDVLEYWFGIESSDPAALARQKQLWFSSSATADQQIAARFGPAVAAAGAGRLTGWAATPDSRLALIILLDQFSRNIYRGLAEAFDNDTRALALTIGGMADGMDQTLPPIQRVFFYMPRRAPCESPSRARGGPPSS